MFKGSDSVNIISAGLPNITGKVAFWAQNYGGGMQRDPQEAFFDTGTNYSTGLLKNDESYGAGRYLGFEAARSNSIYGASDTVQPPSIALIPQIKY